MWAASRQEQHCHLVFYDSHCSIWHIGSRVEASLAQLMLNLAVSGSHISFSVQLMVLSYHSKKFQIDYIEGLFM